MPKYLIDMPNNWRDTFCKICEDKGWKVGTCAKCAINNAIPAKETTIDDYEGRTFYKPHTLYIVEQQP